MLLGLLYGVTGYDTPRSNLESCGGRFDIRLAPLSGGRVRTRRVPPSLAPLRSSRSS